MTIDKLSHFVIKMFKNASGIGPIFKCLQNPSIERPKKPLEIEGEEEVKEMNPTIIAEDIQEYVKRRNVFKKMCASCILFFGDNVVSR